jgi:hypothetical protein
LQFAAQGQTNMSNLPPVLTGHSISGGADNMTIELQFNEEMERGSGMVIITDGAIQTVIDRGTGQPVQRVVGATETHEIPLSMVSIDGGHVTISANGLTAGHQYRVYIAPGALQSNGLPFAGVSSSSLLTFKTTSDSIPPALMDMRMDNLLLTSGKGATLTMVFSEAVKVDPAALVAPNVTVTGLTGSADGRTWHATITPAAGIEAASSNVTLDMRGVHDLANNQGVGTPSLTYQVDTKAPTVSAITLSGLSGIGSALTSPATVKVTFSEKVNIANPSAALVAPHASLTDFHSTDGGMTWVGTLTPQSGTSIPGNQMYVDLAQVVDQSGNIGSGVANAPSTYDVDTQGPGLKTMSLSGGRMNTGGSLTLTFELQESVSVDKAAIIAPNAIVGDDLHTIDNGRTWIVTLTPKAGLQANDNILSIDMGQIRDIHNVPGTGLQEIVHAYDVDTVGPTATLSLSSSKLSGSMPVFVTISFSEPMQTLDKAAIVAQHASVDSVTTSDGGKTWIAKLLPNTASGTVSGNSVSLDMTKVSDLAGNSGAGIVNAPTTFDVDANPPTTTGITLSGSHVTSTGGPTMTVKFSEAVTFNAGAFSLGHATLSGLHSDDNGITWTATVLSDGTGNSSTNAIALDMSKVHDGFGNPGTGAVTSANYDVSVTAPTATITLAGSRITQKGTVAVTVKFNEAVQSLDPSYFTHPNAQLSALTTDDNGITWHGTLSSNANIQAISNTFSLDMSKVQDLSGNSGSGTASAASGYDVDTEPPTATLTLDGNDITATSGVKLTIKFSEAVGSLDASYFTAQNATVSNLTKVDATTWTATLTASGSGNTTGNHVSLDMTKVPDLFGNAGSGSVAAPTAYSVEPAPVGITLDGTALKYGADIMATVKFATKVPTLDPAAITAQHAHVVDLSSTDGGYTWHLTLVAIDSVDSASNVLSIDMTKVFDDSFHAGTGTATSPSYAVDTLVSTYADGVSLYDDTGGHSDTPERYSDGVTNEARVQLVGYLSSSLSGSQSVEVKIDGNPLGIRSYGTGWVYQPTIAPALPDGQHVISVRVVDGGHTSAEYTKTITVDTRAPQVTSTSGDTTQAVDQPLVIHLDEAVSWHGITLSSESDEQSWTEADNYVELVHSGTTERVFINQNNVSADGRTITISANDLHLASGADYTLHLPEALTDLAGNSPSTTEIAFKTSGSYADTAAPRIMAAMAVDQGRFGIGTEIRFAVKFNEPVTSGAVAPELTLNNGAKATYDGTSQDHRTMYFVYSVAATDSTPGNHYLDVAGMGTMPNTVTDLAGNKLAPGSLSLTTMDGYYPYSNVWIDTSVPSTIAFAPVLDASSDSATKGDSITNEAWPTFHGQGATPGAEVLLFDVTSDSWTYIDSTTADDDGTWNLYEVGLDEGSHHLAVMQANDVGNRSSFSPTLSVTIDRTADALALPALDLASDSGTAGDWATSVTTPKLAGSGAEAGAKVEVMEGTVLLQSATVQSDGSWSLTLPTQAVGVHHLSLHQVDVAGNISDDILQDLTIDTALLSKLAAPMLASADTGYAGFDGITNVGTLAFTGGGAIANATIELLQDGAVVTSVMAGSGGLWSLSLPAGLADGTYSFAVRQTDSAHQHSAISDPLSVTIDTVAPSQPGIALDSIADTGVSASDGITNYARPIFSGSGAAPHATIDLYSGTTRVSTGSADASGIWTVSPTAALADGTYSFTVRQSDMAGNTSVSSAVVSVTVDTKAPAALLAPVLASTSDSGVSDHDGITKLTTPTFNGTGAEANTRIDLYEGTSLLGSANSDASGNYSVAVSSVKALSNGVHNLSVVQMDVAGNVSAPSPTVGVTIDTVAPKLGTPSVGSLGMLDIPFNEVVSHSAFGTVEIYDGPSLVHSYTGSDTSAWTDVTSASASYSVLHLTVSQPGSVTLSGTVQDLAGNVTVIGSASFPFTMPATSYFQPMPLY